MFLRVTEPNSGRGIEIYTTQPGVQLYTANGLDGGLVGKHGIAYPKYGAFCLETQNWPDAINHVSAIKTINFSNFTMFYFAMNLKSNYMIYSTSLRKTLDNTVI